MPDPNPYEPPQEPADEKPRQKASVRKIVAIITLAILALPSSAIAGFVTCYTVVMVSEALSPTRSAYVPDMLWFGLLVGCITILAVIGVFIYAAYRINKRVD